MAVVYDESGSVRDDGDGAPVTVWINWAGAVVSFMLMAGLAVWGYKLLVRDVTGVPVVRALEGPMRVAPTDPGGARAEHQDLSVTRVAVAGAAERPTEQVVLAPPPVALTEEDAPMAALIPDTPSAPENAAGTVAEPRSAIELAIAEALGQEVPNSPQAATAAAGDDIALVPASAGGVVASPRPAARPDSVTTLRNAVAISSETDPGGLDVSVEAIPPGTRLVQLGAYPSEDEARAAWEALGSRFGAVFEDKRRVVQEAQAGGTAFFRLRAMGFEDLNDARRFCAVLVADNANCIPVIRR